MVMRRGMLMHAIVKGIARLIMSSEIGGSNGFGSMVVCAWSQVSASGQRYHVLVRGQTKGRHWSAR